MTANIHAMFAFFICPRPVYLLSVADGGRSNIVPMDLLGTVGAGRFSLALKHASSAVPLLRRSRRAALCSVPFVQTEMVYRFGANHLRPVFDWDHAPFGAKSSQTGFRRSSGRDVSVCPSPTFLFGFGTWSSKRSGTWEATYSLSVGSSPTGAGLAAMSSSSPTRSIRPGSRGCGLCDYERLSPDCSCIRLVCGRLRPARSQSDPAVGSLVHA